jgi:hypothetical protein
MSKALDSILPMLITVAISTFVSDAFTQLSYAQENASSFQSLDNNTTQIKNASNESQRDDGISRSSTWQHKCTDSATEPEGQICAEGKQISSEEEEEPHEQKTKICKKKLYT